MFVLDASAVGLLVLRDERTDVMDGWRQRNAGKLVWAPANLATEVGRILQKHSRGVAPEDLARMHADLLAGIDLVTPRLPAADVWRTAARHSYQDAEYVELAQRLGAVLVTADRTMAERAAEGGVPVLAL